MKKLLLLALLLASCSSEPELSTPITRNEAQEEAFEKAVIYVSVASHNEEPSVRQPDYVKDEDLFWESRSALIEFATMLHEEGVMYNWQSDWNFLQAIEQYDTGTPETNGKNVAVWLQEDLGFEIDPHAHESKYSYADVAYLMEKIGLEPSHIAGGFLAAPIEDSKVDYLNAPIEGMIYDTTWTAETMWGGGTGLHIDEEGLWTSGIWRPASNEAFYTDDANAIPNIGNYQRTWEGLEKLLTAYENGELDPEKIYTITIMNDQRNFYEEPGYTEAFREQIQKFQSYEAEGVIAWTGLSEVLEIWETEYDSQPNILYYDESAALKIFSSASGESEKPFKKKF